MITSLTAALGRLARRAASPPAGKSAGPLISIEPLGQPRWSPRDYAAFAREGMMQNPIVYRAIRMVTEAAATVPLLVYVDGEEVDDHPLARLLSRPNPQQGRADLMETWLGHLLIAGSGYLEAVEVAGELRELHTLRPDRMRSLEDENGWVAGYEYRTRSGTVTLTGDVIPGVPKVLQLKLFNPLSDHEGLSPIAAAATAIDIHNAASRWNKALLDNAARPSGALIYTSGGHLTAEQFERLKGELAENFQGARNAGRPLLLEGGLDWKAMSLTPKDMDFIDAKHTAAREIALAIGVPPMLIGIPGDNTYANYQEANRTFWRQTVLPLAERAAHALAIWLAPAYPGRITLVPDLDRIDALSAEREAAWSRLQAATFLTTNEKRSALGYGNIEGGDQYPG